MGTTSRFGPLSKLGPAFEVSIMNLNAVFFTIEYFLNFCSFKNILAVTPRLYTLNVFIIKS